MVPGSSRGLWRSSVWRTARGVAGVWLLAFISTQGARAGNGDLIGISDVLDHPSMDVADLCLDSSDATFWVLGASGATTTSHRIYHVSSDLQSELGSIDNPHPSGAIETSNLTTNRGIAFRQLSRTLFVLSSVGPRGDQVFEVWEVNRVDGSKVGVAPIVVAPPDEDASLYGLAYDLLDREFWTLDAQNDKLIRFDLSGQTTRSFALPNKSHPDEVLKGKGVAYGVESIPTGVAGRLYVSTGDIFDSGPSKIIQLTTEGVLIGEEFVGQTTGITVPLKEIPTPDRRGFELYTIGLLRRVAVLGDQDRIFELEFVISSPTAPANVEGSLTRDNKVVLSWTNHGTGPGGAYGGTIQILRNGVAFASVPGTTTTYMDETPVEGTSTYALRASDVPDGPLSELSLEVEVTVGNSGVIDWTPTGSISTHDVTVDPVTGIVYVTDPITAGGRILRFDSELQSLGEIPSPWSQPGGITFVETIGLGFPEQPFSSLLAVAETVGNRLRLIDPNDLGQPPITTITLSFPAEVLSPRIGGLTYIPAEEWFVAVETGQSQSRLHIFNKNGTPVYDCVPPEIQVTSPINFGVTYDPIQDSLLTLFQESEGTGVKEIGLDVLHQRCPALGFEFGLRSLGDLTEDSMFPGGVQIDGNTLLVCGRSSSALFRVLIFPFTPPFIRGDFDDNQDVNVTDAFNLAAYLFQGGGAPSCQDAADCNDDGVLDVGDPVYLLFWLFVEGSSAPPLPYPEAGNDPTFRDNLGCAG